jgi:phosphate transport system substrate-binding protein
VLHRHLVATVFAVTIVTFLALPAGVVPRARGGSAGGTLTPATDTRTTAHVTLNGAGANSIYPFFQPVFYDYNLKDPNTTINYNPAGSSVGVSDIQQGTVNFGDSEVPMTTEQLGAAQSPQILQIPVDLGGVALSYNLPGVTARIDLDGPTLAAIFQGEITNWNSPAIAAVTHLNDLPNLRIVPVHRADSSGTGYDFDAYLIKTAPGWATRVGTSTPSRSWPLPKIGVGEQLNTGVATYIKQTPGAIGFLEYGYALESGFTSAAVKNRAGVFVTPSERSIAAAGLAAHKLTPFNFSIIYEPGASTYPIANFSWTLVYREQSNTAVGVALGKLIYYVVNQGQKLAGKLGYAPLPSDVDAYAMRTIERLEGPSGSLLFAPASGRP